MFFLPVRCSNSNNFEDISLYFCTYSFVIAMQHIFRFCENSERMTSIPLTANFVAGLLGHEEHRGHSLPGQECDTERYKLRQRVICPECGMTFASRGNYTRHQQLHSGYKPFICDVCGKSFVDKNYLVYHRRTHTGERPHTCDICGETFPRRHTMTGHWKRHSDDEEHSCDDCGKMFVQRGQAAYHRLVHCPTRSVSGKKSTQQGDATRHSRLNDPGRSDVSVKKFTQQDDVTRHCRVNDPDRSDVCGKSFTQHSKMAALRHVHTGVTPACQARYRCDACGKPFTEWSDFTRHREKHAEQWGFLRSSSNAINGDASVRKLQLRAVL